MKITKEVKTAILVLSGIILVIFGFNYLKGQNLLESRNLYYTEFDYNALNNSSLVTVKGNPVGKIKDISYDFNTGKTRVAFLVNEQLAFSKNTVIKMYETGLMGGNGLAILVSDDGEKAKSGDLLKSEVEFGLITSLSKNFEGLGGELNTTLKSADTLLTSLNKLVEDDSEAGLKNMIKELNVTLKSFKNTSNSANGLLAKNDENIKAILENFKKFSGDLTSIANELKTANLGSSVESLNKTLNNLNSILAAIDNGEGTLGKLLKDEGLYSNLEGASLQLEQLLEDMKLNPKRYVHFSLFGKKPKQFDAKGNEIKEQD